MWRLLLRCHLALAAAENLALFRVPVGSSDTYEAEFGKATDGDSFTEWRSRHREPRQTLPTWRVPEPRFGQAPPVSQTQWRLPTFAEMSGDYPGFLLVDLGAPSQIEGMRLSTNQTAGGFETLRTYRSRDGIAWHSVREERSRIHCDAGVSSQHGGWPEETRYVLIELQSRCSGVHQGTFALAEWEVMGAPAMDMVARLWRSWPQCEDLGPCFEFMDLEQAKAKCLADEACDGFSFSAAAMSGGRGSGCFKTYCAPMIGGDGDARPMADENSTERPTSTWYVPFGRGSHGYWAKRRRNPPPEPQRATPVTKPAFPAPPQHL